MIHSYSSPINLGHKDSFAFFDGGEYIVQEKIDGSQFSFGVYDNGLECRSHGAQIDLDNPPKMFLKGISTVRNIEPLLEKGWTYRGELLDKPRHNVLTYSRVPTGNIILYDIDRGNQDYVPMDQLAHNAEYLGLETVAYLGCYSGIPSKELLEQWLSTPSVLGGTLVEGVVLKNYSVVGRDGKLMMVKYVSNQFKEVHDKTSTPQNDILTEIFQRYVGEARWQKAVQHLSEIGSLEQDVTDIGPLLKEISADFDQECSEEIKDLLWKHYRKTIVKEVVRGFPEWYKQSLIDKLQE